jgi:hypothetical protein
MTSKTTTTAGLTQVTALTITTDKTTYAAGATITATLKQVGQVINLSGTAGPATATGQVTLTWPMTLADDAGHTWVQASLSADGLTAVYTTKA